ncbi:MAG TPA: hypothetical protein PLN89_06120, partial [Elusimicrobiota bacterium]|nr:hypothetical protein [Elusimicrobiota bacterium]
LVSSRDYVKDGQTYRDTVTTWNIKVLKFDDVGNLVQSLLYRTQTTTVLASARPSDPPIEVTVAETEARAGTRMGGFGGARSGTVILRAADSDSVWADKMNNGDDRNINGHYLPWLNSFAVESLKRLAGLHRNRARAADDIARSTTDVDIAAKRMETDTADLNKADQAVSSARSALVAAQNAARSFRAEFESMDSTGRAVLEAAKARMTGRLQTDAAALAKTFSGLDLILNGPLRLTEEEALALVTRGAFDHAGQSLSLGALASAKVKTNLNNEEHFAQLSVANPQKSVSLSWKGDLRLNGAPVTKTALSAVLTPNALAAPPADGSVSGLSVGEGGRLTVNRTLAQTQDAAGRITSQNTETLTLSRTDGKTMTRRTRQETAGHRYDARGQLIGYVRTTREDGKDPVVETLTGATYDDTGRQTSSDVRVTEASANGLVSRNVHTDILSFNAAGQADRSRRAVNSGGQVTVTQDVADTLFDGEGRAVFALSESVATSRESWERAGGNFAALTGERTRSAGWTTAFDDRGQALSTLRVSTPNLGGTARHFIIETNRNTYDGAGRLSLSTTDSTEIGSDPKSRSTLYKSVREERRAVAFAAGGQA